MLTTASIKKKATAKVITIGKPKEAAEPVLADVVNSAMAHSRVGPSSSERWLNCLGSVLFTADMPNVGSWFADEGNAAHELSERVRESGKPAHTFIGTVIKINDNEFTVDAGMASAVQQFVDFCEELDGEPFYEERVNYTEWVPNGWGTADDIRIEVSGTCHVTDLKYGKGVQVYAKNNPQLKLYALGVFQDYHHLYDITEFHLTIHQPRLGHVDQVYLTVKELLTWARDVVAPAAAEALDPTTDSEFAVGSWCQFCPAAKSKDGCPERDRIMMEEKLSDFDEFPVIDDTVPNFKLGEILDKAGMIRTWLNECDIRAVSQVQQGIPVTGKDGEYKMVAGRSGRFWKEDDTATEKLLRSAKLKVADIFTKKLITPPQAEKLLGRKHPLLEKHVGKAPGKPVLVPGSDPRPTLQLKAEEEFEELAPEE